MSAIKRAIHWLNIVVLLIYFSSPSSAARFKFTNAKCQDYDVAYSHFEKCKLSVPRRGVISFDLDLKFYKPPVSNASINMALFRRVNGYQPFLFNKTADLCAYFAQRNKYPVFHMIFSIFVKNSNLNHTCPYYGSVFINDLVLDEKMFQLLPMPNGQYLFKFLFYAYNDLKGSIEVFVSRAD